MRAQRLVQRPVKPPTAPVLSVSADSSTQLRVRLATPASFTLPPLEYVLEGAATSTGPWAELARGALIFGTAGYPDSSLSPAQVRFYRAYARDISQRQSPYSAVASGTTSNAADTQRPTRMRGLAVTVSGRDATITSDPSCDPDAGSQLWRGLAESRLEQNGTQVQTKASAAGLRAPLQVLHIGGATGNATRDGGDWTLTTTGTGITGTADSCSMIVAEMTAIAAFVSAECPGFSSASANAKSGVWIRQDADPASPFVHVFPFTRTITGGGTPRGLGLRIRRERGGDVESTLTDAGITGATVHVELRQTSSGTQQAYYSMSGAAWVPFGPEFDVPFTVPYLMGAPVSSDVGAGSVTASILDLTIQTLGPVSFTVTDLPDGNHDFTMKASDGANVSLVSVAVRAAIAAAGSYLPAPSNWSPNCQGWPNVSPFNLTAGFFGDPDVFWVTSRADSYTATPNFKGKANHWSGSLTAALLGSWGRGGDRGLQIYSLTSGIDQHGGDYQIYKGNLTYNGATAPGQGLHLPFGSRLLFNASNILIGHLGIRGVFPADPDAADGIAFYTNARRIVVKYSSVGNMSDESIDFTGRPQTERVAVVNSIVGEPLVHTRPVGDEDYQHGYIAIVDYDSRGVIFGGNLTMHSNGRDLGLTGSDDVQYIDNVRFNSGYTPPDPAWSDQMLFRPPSNQDRAMRCNTVGSIFLAGPNPPGASKPIRCIENYDLSYPSGSRLGFSNNFYFDPLNRWTYSQSNQLNHVDLFTSVPGDLLQSTSVSSIWLTGYTSMPVPLIGNQPDPVVLLDKMDRTIRQAGMFPSVRPGRDSILVQQPSNFARQENSSNWGAHTSTPYTYSIPVLTIDDPFAEGAFGNDPYPWANPGAIESNGLRADQNWSLRREQSKGCRPWPPS